MQYSIFACTSPPAVGARLAPSEPRAANSAAVNTVVCNKRRMLMCRIVQPCPISRLLPPHKSSPRLPRPHVEVQAGFDDLHALFDVHGAGEAVDAVRHQYIAGSE